MLKLHEAAVIAAAAETEQKQREDGSTEDQQRADTALGQPIAMHSVVTSLQALVQLKADGHLTEAEFSTAKARVLVGGEHDEGVSNGAGEGQGDTDEGGGGSSAVAAVGIGQGGDKAELGAAGQEAQAQL